MKDNMKEKKAEIPEMEKVPEGFHSAVLEALEKVRQQESAEQTAFGEIEVRPLVKQKGFSGSRKKIKKGMLIPLAAALCLAVGGTVIAAASLYRQRMEAMNREMLEEFYNRASVGDTFHYNRDISDSEEARMEILTKAYEENGSFPEGTLQYLSSYEAYEGKGIGLYADRSTLFLPEKEMSDEELLQIIDFYHKTDYSIQKINEQAAEGISYPETSVSVPESDGKQLFAYEGSVEAVCMAETTEYLYLAGNNGIERIPIGSSVSEPFYAEAFGVNMVPYAMEADLEQGVYVSLLERGEDNYVGGKLLHIGNDGTLLWEKDITETLAAALAVDGSGRLFAQNFDQTISVYDVEGNEICTVDIPHSVATRYSICRAKDGNIYLLCEKESFDKVIMHVDPEAKQCVQVAADFLPVQPPHTHMIAQGKNSDFVIWDYEGIYTYNLGDTAASKVMELYEAPLQWEDASSVVLEDGRVVFMKAYEYTYDERYPAAGVPVPDSIRFAYVTLE